MNWANLWMKVFGTTTLCGLDMGFWVAIAAVFLIVVLMNAVFWGMKPKNPDLCQSSRQHDTKIMSGAAGEGTIRRRGMVSCAERI